MSLSDYMAFSNGWNDASEGKPCPSYQLPMWVCGWRQWHLTRCWVRAFRGGA